MNVIRIDDPGDPRVAPFLSVRDRDLAGRGGCFVAEGKVVLGVLIASTRFEAESVLVLESRMPGLADVLDRAPSGLPVYVASQAVMDEIVGFHIHRGVLAIGRRREPVSASRLIAALPPGATVVVLIGLSNHDNVGAIFRNAAAFGADAVLLDRTCCDPLYRKAIRVSVGAALTVPFAVAEDAGAIVGMLDDAQFDQIALSPGGAADIRTLPRPQRLALYLGAEGPGLPKQLLARLRTVRIGISPGFDSLNVAAASAVALHHFMRRQHPA